MNIQCTAAFRYIYIPLHVCEINWPFCQFSVSKSDQCDGVNQHTPTFFCYFWSLWTYEKFVLVKKSGNVNVWTLIQRRPNFISTFLLNPKFKAGRKKYLGRLQFFLLNLHKGNAFIWCFVKFQFYPLDEDEIIRKTKQTIVSRKCPFTIYYKRYNQQREYEKNNCDNNIRT